MHYENLTNLLENTLTNEERNEIFNGHYISFDDFAYAYY